MNFLNSVFSKINTQSRASTGVVGIDVGSSSIKVVELQERNGVITLTTYGEVQLGPYGHKTAGESVSLEVKQEQLALAEVIKASSVQVKNAVVAMPLSSSFVTNVSIEAESGVDLAAMVRIEARKVIPASLSEITLDWAEVEVTQLETETAAANHRSVLIAAIQNTAFERFKILSQFAGLNQPPVEIECFSSIRSAYDSKETDIVIIDIGATSSKLYIARKGLLMRMHRIRAGGAVASKQIAEVLNVDFQTAEQLKLESDKTKDTYLEMKRAHNSSYARAFREFNQVLREYEQKTGIHFDSVYLSGGGSVFPGTDVYLSETLGRNVNTLNPFSKVAYPAFMEDTMKELGPSFSVAIGAALRAFE